MTEMYTDGIEVIRSDDGGLSGVITYSPVEKRIGREMDISIRGARKESWYRIEPETEVMKQGRRGG